MCCQFYEKRTIFKLKIFKINVQVFFESWHTLYGNIFSEQFNAVFFFCYTLKHRAHIYSSTIFCYYVYINMNKNICKNRTWAYLCSLNTSKYKMRCKNDIFTFLYQYQNKFENVFEIHLHVMHKHVIYTTNSTCLSLKLK